MNKAIVYTSATCPYCVKEINCDENFDEMCANLSQKYNQPCISTVPQIIINDNYVGGYDDLEHLYKTNELDRILN